MLSFKTKSDPKRAAFLNLIESIERQLREAYERKFREGRVTQTSLAKKLGVGKSVINRRLTGRTNMTAESVAAMVWGLGHEIEVRIFDPAQTHGKNYLMAPPIDEPQTPAEPAPPAFPQRSLGPEMLDYLNKMKEKMVTT